MRAKDFPANTLRKFRTPSTWGAILVYGFAWSGARLLLDMPMMLSPWMEFQVPFLLVTAQVALAPLPWLWTGDDRPQAPPLRGLLQALPWDLLWILACLGMIFLPAGSATGNMPDMKFHFFGRSIPVRPQWGIVLLNLPLALILGWFIADKERAETSERELRVLADKARGQVLQAQLNPHVLFNVLSGITELVHEDPDAAEEALVGLVEMYRELVRHGTAATAPLRNERTLVQRYLGIEAIRLGGRLRMEWAWPAWADALELPPLLLQPLVENAIKHGIGPCPEGGALRVSVERAAGSLVLKVANGGLPLDPAHRDGTGLGNLRQRLELLGGLRPALDLFTEGDWTVARLALAWKEAP